MSKIILKSGKKIAPLFTTEDSMKLDTNGTWSEGSIVVGRGGIADKRKQQQEDVGDEYGKPMKYSLDSLERLELLGAGSSGKVYHVIHRPSKEHYALKAILMDCSKAARIALLDELRAMSRLSHPNIVSCADAFLAEGILYILLEYFDCGSLANLLSVSGPIPERIVANFAKQMLEGIHYCHSNKYIHRDLKPSNFLVNSKGVVKIADFGTSSRLQGNASVVSTWVGTVTYMSPERISGGDYTYASDIWSYGLTVFELAVSRYPYPPADIDGRGGALGFWDLLDLIIQKPSPKLDEEEFSKEFCEFIDACLEKDPAKRASAEALLKHPFLQQSNCATMEEVQSWMSQYVPQVREQIKKSVEATVDLSGLDGVASDVL